jgi:hypothetical protein
LKKREVTFLLVSLVLAAVVGGLIGDIIGTFLPQGAVKTLFEKTISIGFGPLTLELYTLSLTIGLVIYFRWWFL